MSVESAKAFYKQVATDAAFLTQLLNASDDQRRERVNAAGYRFTQQEWEVVLAHLSALNERQLSDAELAAIAGGLVIDAEAQAVFADRPHTTGQSRLAPAVSNIKHWLRPFYQPAWSIKTKLSVALLSVALIPMGLTAYYNLQDSLDKATADEYRKLELSATSKAGQLDQLILGHQRVVVQVGTEKDVIGFLAASKPEQQKALRPDLQRTLDNVFRSNPNYDAVYLMDREGRSLAGTDPALTGQNYASQDYFQQAIQGRPYVSSLQIDPTSQRSGIYFSNPVRSDSGRILGVVVMKIKGEEVQAIVNAPQKDSQIYAFLVDQHGVIISHPEESFLHHSLVPLPPGTPQHQLYGSSPIESLNIPPLAKGMVNAQEPGHTRYDSPLDQTRQIVGFAPLDTEPWVLGVNKSDFAAPLNNIVLRNGLSVLAVGGIATILAMLLARSIARPIRALTEAAEALEQDTFEPHTLAKLGRPRDDIGQLVRVFLQMAQELRAREQKLKLQVQELHIEIDQSKKTREVAAITETDYFQQLQQKSRKLRGRAVEVEE